MARELERPREETERWPALHSDVVRAMGPGHVAEVAQPQQELHRQASVNQAIVNDRVRRAEDGHADAGAERELPGESGRCTAAVHHERDGDRGVQHAQGVVPLEPPAARDVVRAVDAPQPRVPDAPVQERRPELHGDGDHRRDGQPHHDGVREDGHRAALRGGR